MGISIPPIPFFPFLTFPSGIADRLKSTLAYMEMNSFLKCVYMIIHLAPWALLGLNIFQVLKFVLLQSLEMVEMVENLSSISSLVFVFVLIVTMFVSVNTASIYQFVRRFFV